MNITNLKNTYNVLITHMKNNNYSQRYIEMVNTEIKKVIKNGETYESYLEYYLKSVKNTEKQGKRKYRLDLLNLIMNFDLYGILPNRYKFKNKIIDNSNYSKLNDEYKKVIDIHHKVSKKNGKKNTTIHSEALRAASFFIHIQNKGITKLKDITENDVLDFFVDDNNNLIKSCSYKKNIKAVIKAGATEINECTKILNYLPILRENRKNINFLKADEIEGIKNTLNCESSDINYRDKAIVTILLYTGLRACDIANLNLTDIDWEEETINIIQNKTDIELQLPLIPQVGNAIYEYIANERPKSQNANLFLRQDANLPITTSSVNIAVNKIMNKAQIRMKKGVRRGTHIFRYHLATFLLENNVPQPVITQTLGNRSPLSLEPYLHADLVHLKECSLSVEKFSNLEVKVND